ncbi:TPA: hypothetical protein ACMHIG_001765 [Neisseria lactamica]
MPSERAGGSLAAGTGRDLPAKWQKRFFATKIYALNFSDRVRKWKYGIF